MNFQPGSFASRLPTRVCCFLASSFVTLALGAESRTLSRTPSQQGLVASALQPFVDEHILAGAVTLVASKDKVLEVEAVGYADLATRTPMRADNVFWIASMSKPITATALMMLVDEGRVKLDDPVEKYLPEFKGQMVAVGPDHHLEKPIHAITVRNILSHTSGLPFKSPLEEPTLDLFPLRDRVKSYARLPLEFQPGAKYQYANAGLNTAGRIIEVVSGQPYAQFLDQRLFGPLGMVDTTFWPSAAQIARLAKSYRFNADTSALEELQIEQLKYPLNDRSREPMPAGGLFSTAADLARFCQMILNGGTFGGRHYISAAAINLMATRQSPPGGPQNYGLGWQMAEGNSLQHGGAYKTHMQVDRANQLVLILLMQHKNFPNQAKAKAIIPTFQKTALDAWSAGLARAQAGAGPPGIVTVYPAPAGEEMSDRFAVKVQEHEVPVYALKVAAGDPVRRWQAMDDKKNSGDYFDKAAFAYFDFRGTVTVVVTGPEEIRSAKILPASFQLVPTIDGKSLTFTLTTPRNLTIEINGDAIGSLHVFANPPETDASRPNDPNVVYFGPGIHEVSRLVIGSNQTVYVAGGAVVRGVVGPEEKFTLNRSTGLRSYAPTFELQGNHITVRGRGIIDGSLCPPHARNLLMVRGQDILIEGVILRDASTWNIPIRQSDRVIVRNARILGHRANSDGIDICNSRDVTVEGCFLRTLDDLIVVKADKGKGEVHRVVARDCVLWNEVAHALSVGAELCEAVDDVRFVNCDVIHDQGREWTLRVYHCDGARVSNVRFENIRIEESRRLMSLWIGTAIWSRDETRGRIQGVTFSHIRATADPGRVELKGFDADHRVDDVAFQDVVVNGRPLAREDVTTNAFVGNVTVQP